MMTNNTEPKMANPWYKEPWPWLLMLGPFIVVIAGFVTFYIAVNTDDTLVTDDYYKDGKNIILQIHKDEEAAKRNLHAKILFNSNKNSARIFLEGDFAKDEPIILSIQHPTLAKQDQSVTLKPISNNLYQVELKQLAHANYWYLALEDTDKKWKIQGRWYSASGNEAILEPSLNKVPETTQSTS
ncbi:FixH family protein [Neisseria sp. Ec49-e6-T10]|uniref:FixH family protein n=1 Tax=Neisseria sp. Ec49-e6-T10 TaxID=3140744 RepID=UPI003EBF8A50